MLVVVVHVVFIKAPVLNSGDEDSGKFKGQLWQARSHSKHVRKVRN